MYIRITFNAGDLKREEWSFYVTIESGINLVISLNSYTYQTRETKRHRVWRNEKIWERLDHRYNTIEKPAVPAQVDTDVRNQLKKMVDMAQIG